MEVLVTAALVAWLVRILAEEAWATIRGIESPRITRKRARQELARAAGVPSIGQAAAARIATAIAPKPDKAPRRHPALEYLRARWEDAWDELLESHHEEMRRRAQQRRDRQAREAERLRREREGSGQVYDDIVDAEIVDDAVCSCGAPAVADGLCADCLDVPNPVCDQCGNRHMDGACPKQTTPGWRETTGGAERADRKYHQDQDGDAYQRRWEQPHPSGFGRLRTTATSWAQDDGVRRWIVTQTVWQWIGDDETTPRFEEEDRTVSDHDGPSGELWPTPDDVRRAVDDTQPAAPQDTPLAVVLDAVPCPGGCGTWVVSGMCAKCEDQRVLPATKPPAPEQGAGQHDPEPDQGPANTDSGPAAHLAGGTPPVSETTYINPDILDATGALRCAEGSLTFTHAVRQQMEKLGANAERGLRGNVPAVQAIRAFEADIAATAITINALVEEHVTHVRTQSELAGDENLKNAAIGYLDARHRA